MLRYIFIQNDNIVVLKNLKMKHKIVTTISILLISININAQSIPFDIYLEPLNINQLGGLQSYAWGQHNGKWLIIGGRVDGLHQRQPFASFDAAGNNNQLIVIDPVAKQKWTASISSFYPSLKEQLSSTNMEFYQDGAYLYMLGGYGYSATAGDHITYPNLTAVNVADAIDAVINNTSLTSSFRQMTDTMFAVTGGYLNKIYDTYYLTGGQKFMGRYNPMGPTHGPGFVQIYTNAIRKFTINDNGNSLSVKHLNPIIDANNLHRRDYNVVPQIMPNGTEGLTAFSGVFQANADLPYLNCVNIDSFGHTVNNAFSQYYNHYHCAHIPLFSSSKNEMHTLFFGGIAQYFDSANILVQDNNVPFVKTIARVTRDANGVMKEYKLPIEMPSYLGSGSEFIPNLAIPQFDNEVIKMDDITADSVLLGYIYGGISSTAANIFFINNGTQSSASSQIFKVYAIKNKQNNTDQLNEQSVGSLKMQIAPNPVASNFTIKFNLKKQSNGSVKLLSIDGKIIATYSLAQFETGENELTIKLKDDAKRGMYLVEIETETEKAIQKIVY